MLLTAHAEIESVLFWFYNICMHVFAQFYTEMFYIKFILGSVRVAERLALPT